MTENEKALAKFKIFMTNPKISKYFLMSGHTKFGYWSIIFKLPFAATPILQKTALITHTKTMLEKIKLTNYFVVITDIYKESHNHEYFQVEIILKEKYRNIKSLENLETVCKLNNIL